MTGHRAIKSQRDGPAIDAQETVGPVPGSLKADIETQPIDIELFGNVQIVYGQNRYGSFHV